MLSRKGVIVKYTLGLDNNCVKYHLIRDMLTNYIYDVYVMKDIFRYIKMIDLKYPWGVQVFMCVLMCNTYHIALGHAGVYG